MSDGNEHNHAITVLSAKISSRILELLDDRAPSFFLMFDHESTRLQADLEETVRVAAQQFLDEM
jgi:hypothetical protein